MQGGNVASGSILHSPNNEQMSDAGSDADFLQMIQDKINSKMAYKVTKHGFQYSSEERLEALAFKHRLKQAGRLEKKDKLTFIKKKSYKSF